jgi:hypothetical protein
LTQACSDRRERRPPLAARAGPMRCVRRVPTHLPRPNECTTARAGSRNTPFCCGG